MTKTGVPIVDVDALPPQTRESYDRLPKLNIFKVWANAQTIFPAAIRYGNSILTKMKLSSLRRELVILAVGRLEGGHYEWVQHVPIAKKAGCIDAQIAAVENLHFDDAAFDAAEKALLRMTREIVLDVRASDAAMMEASKHFDSQELVEIILTVGFYMTVARLTETARVEIDAPRGVAVPTFKKVR